MQTRYSDENSVCPSVCPSVTRVIPDKTEERSVQIRVANSVRQKYGTPVQAKISSNLRW